MGNRTTFDVILLNYIMDVHMLSRGTLVPAGSWRVLCNKASRLLSLTYVVFFWYSDLTSHTQTHIKTHTTPSGASRLTHPYKYIFTPPYGLTGTVFITLNE